MIDGQTTTSKYARRKSHKTWRELSTRQKHWRNILGRLLVDYFGILIMVVVVLVLAGCYKYLIIPKYASILGLIKTTYFEQDKLAPKFGELSSYRKILETYQSLNPADIKKVEGIIPDKYVKEDLFSELVYLISQKGYKIETIDITSEADSGAATVDATSRSGAVAQSTDTTKIPSNLPIGVKQVDIKLEISKINYAGLKSLLWLMENSLRLLDIKSLAFDPAKNHVSLEMSSYYFE